MQSKLGKVAAAANYVEGAHESRKTAQALALKCCFENGTAYNALRRYIYLPAIITLFTDGNLSFLK